MILHQKLFLFCGTLFPAPSASFLCNCNCFPPFSNAYLCPFWSDFYISLWALLAFSLISVSSLLILLFVVQLKTKKCICEDPDIPFLFLFKLGTWSSRFLAFFREGVCSDEVDGAALLSLRAPACPGEHWDRGGGICKQFTKHYNRQRPLFHSICDQKSQQQSKDISFSPNNLW